MQGDRVLIGNNRGGTNDWVNRAAVYGVRDEAETMRRADRGG